MVVCIYIRWGSPPRGPAPSFVHVLCYFIIPSILSTARLPRDGRIISKPTAKMCRQRHLRQTRPHSSYPHQNGKLMMYIVCHINHIFFLYCQVLHLKTPQLRIPLLFIPQYLSCQIRLLIPLLMKIPHLSIILTFQVLMASIKSSAHITVFMLIMG